MNEEIEYAEMLEIPVSTVNVVQKKSARKRKAEKKLSSAPKKEFSLQDSVIERINGKVGETLSEQANAESVLAAEQITADAALFAEGANSQGKLDLGDIPDRVDTVRLYSAVENRQRFNELTNNEEYALNEEDFENDAPMYEANPLSKQEKRVKVVLGAEFAAVCALCGAIFLTNVFVPHSAINTFFRTLHSSVQTTADTRTYSDFALNSIVGDFSQIELTVSPTGVISFTGESCVYPAADGKVHSITQNADGTYTVKITHSDTFSAVMSGLDFVYYAQGEEVKSNVPIGYSEGETEVQVTMYSDGALLSCFEVTEENCLAWVTQQ